MFTVLLSYVGIRSFDTIRNELEDRGIKNPHVSSPIGRGGQQVVLATNLTYEQLETSLRGSDYTIVDPEKPK